MSKVTCSPVRKFPGSIWTRLCHWKHSLCHSIKALHLCRWIRRACWLSDVAPKAAVSPYSMCVRFINQIFVPWEHCSVIQGKSLLHWIYYAILFFKELTCIDTFLAFLYSASKTWKTWQLWLLLLTQWTRVDCSTLLSAALLFHLTKGSEEEHAWRLRFKLLWVALSFLLAMELSLPWVLTMN